MQTKKYDVVVVGTGTASHTLLDFVRAGKKCAVIDEIPYGGTCALRGCQPKKYLVANSEALQMFNNLVGKGLDGQGSVNWKDLMALREDFTDGLSEAVEDKFKGWGVDTYHGSAFFEANKIVNVNGELLEGEKIVIGTGARPRPLNIPGAEHAQISDYFLYMDEMPRSILFIGAGYISFEFGHIARRAGAEVTILHRSAQPLRGFEPECVNHLIQATRDIGIEFELENEPTEIVKHDDHFDVFTKKGNMCEVDLIISAGGRIPNVENLKLENTGVEYSKKGIHVDPYMCTVSNPDIFAIGDVADQGLQLATVADKQAHVAAQNILYPKSEEMDYTAIPSAVFTQPTMSSVGMHESHANEAGLDYRINRGFTKGWPSSRRMGEEHGFYKVLIENGTNRILGAHLLRHGSADVINVFALAIKQGMKNSDLKEVLWAYPTLTSDLKYMIS